MNPPRVSQLFSFVFAVLAVPYVLFPAPTPPPNTLIALGTAQDGGYPQVACSCDRCQLARRDPKLARKVASLAIRSASGKTYLIDATPDLPAQIEAIHRWRAHPTDRTDRQPVDGILLTHAHIGHYLGLAWLGFETLSSREIPVWASPRMAGFLRANGPWSQLVGQKNIVLHEFTPGQAFELEPGLSVEPIQVPHRDELSDTFAFVIRGPRRTVLYVPDTDSWRAWKKPLLEVLADKKIDLALLDGTFYSRAELPDRDPATIGHPLITDTMDLLGAKVKAGGLEVRFTHLNHSNLALGKDDAARKNIAAHGFRLLADGDEIGL
ncbi:MAG TPA: MBL fold metallo-hydrolase [Thermoanaerobaculia bacterium]|jgi:pyrroloquinoline quinone biosynthesis protein B|nr:MBL fold metallo-hydrolase [Thermoanaerobaculia bacterium]